MAQRVNLDPMIPRADFATVGQEHTHQLFKDFPIANLESMSSIRLLLRKPDFQRETNHWTPEQIATFIASFLDSELIPAIILWKSTTHIFVIDGGHRLSALRAWMEDDYGDGAISVAFYGGEISDQQRKIAKRTRLLVEKEVGRYTALKALVGSTSATQAQQQRAGTLVTRALDLQWVHGNADRAESSFFKINSQGTPLDDVEEMLLRNRTKAIAIAARSILRAGTGYKYWSHFSDSRQKEIEALASECFDLLFDPEEDQPIKTLDLPLGGTVSPIHALALLVDFLLISSSGQNNERSIKTDVVDKDGSGTAEVLGLSKEIAGRITGNDAPSLGLHPAVYFYNERGVHSRHFFLGMTKLITQKVRNNDQNFFKQFTTARAALEDFLVKNKSLLTQMLTNVNRDARVNKVRDMLDWLVKKYIAGETFKIEDLLSAVGLEGHLLDVRNRTTSTRITDETKAAIFLRDSLAQSLKCPYCKGMLYPRKAVSFDHKIGVKSGGTGDLSNAQMMHPFCNSIKG